MPIRDVMIRLGLNSAPFVAGIKQAELASAGLATNITRNATAGSKSAAVLGSSFGTVGLIAGAAAVSMVKAAAQFDQAMANVNATGAVSQKQLRALRDEALAMGRTTVYSATEAAGGMETLLKAGLSAKDVMSGGLKGALDLAAAGTMDLGQASEIASAGMAQFGLSGKDIPHIADLLAAGAGKAQGDVSDLGMALNQVGLVAHGAGFSIEETTGVLAEFANAGLKGSDAGTSLRTLLLRLQAPVDAARAALTKYHIATRDSNGEMLKAPQIAHNLQTAFKDKSKAERDAAFVTIFGQDAIRGANVLYQDGAGKAQAWADAVDDAGYAAEVAAKKNDTLNGDLKKLSNTWNSFLAEGGDKGGLNDFLRGGVQGATDELTKTKQDIKDIEEGLGNVARLWRGYNPVALGNAGRIGAKTGVPSNVVTKFQTVGAEGSLRKIMAVARAANLTPKQVRSVLQALGWNPAKINAVIKALRTAENVSNVRATMTALGFSPAKINAVTDALKGAKSQSQVRARLIASGFKPDQIKAIFTLLRDLGALPPAKPKVDAQDKATPKLTAVQKKWADLLGLPDINKTVTVTTVNKTVTAKAGGGSIHRAWGGSVSGPGTETSDSIPAWLSDGEHVLTASDVRMAGGQDAVYRLRAGIQAGEYSFAKGGKVKKGGGGVSPTFLSGEKAAEEARLEQAVADGVKELATKKKGQSLTGWARRVAELELADNRAALARLRTGGSVDGTSPLDAIADAKQSLIDAANSPISLFGGASDSPWMSGGSFAARATQKLTQIRTLAGKLYQLRQAGLNGALLSELYSLDARSGIAAADELLRSPSEIGQLNAAYSGIQSANGFAAAVGYAAPVTPGIKVTLEGFRVDLANMTAATQIVVRDEVGRELQRQSFDSKVGV